MIRILISKGAEADLFLRNWHGREVIIKKRYSKKYRVKKLDKQIRNQRTKSEPLIMHKAKEIGVSTPIIYMVDLRRKLIIMEYIEGIQVKKVLDGLPETKRIELCFKMGKIIGKLHENGIIHGDLTTSNMILTPDNKIVLIDFGLSEIAYDLESRGIDLHLMKRAFAGMHSEYAEQCFQSVMQGYKEETGSETFEVLHRVAEIEKRGRYSKR